jgi:hypothetical protein
VKSVVKRVLSYSALFEEGFSWPLNSLDLNPCNYFLWGYLNDKVFQKDPQTIPELETAIQSETPIKVQKIFVLRRVLSSEI